MSMTFTKLFSSITASTIWAEPDHTRLVWITMLAMADQHGRVWASIPGLANMARVTIERCEEALTALSGPDKYSRTKEFEGRRIEEIDGGWRLLNHGKYRAIRDEESIKESKRRWAANNRKKVENVEESRTESNSVDRGRANTEAEADTEAKEKKEKRVARGSRLPQDWTCPDVWIAWCRQERPDLDPHRVAEDFGRYWQSRAGAGATKVDWYKTWQLWVSKERATPTSNPHSQAKTFKERDAEVARAKVALWTGGLLGGNPDNTLDMEPPNGILPLR